MTDGRSLTTRRVVKTVEGIPPEAVERGSLCSFVRALVERAERSHEDYVFVPDIEAILAQFEHEQAYRPALEEIAEIPGRSVASIIARRALNGQR